jgi:Phospholipase_D-nuclease N-terminal
MPLAMSSFWQWFFLFLIWVPLVMLWATALVDIFRRPDLGGGAKVLWVLIIFVIPWIGALIYLAVRPRAIPA